MSMKNALAELSFRYKLILSIILLTAGISSVAILRVQTLLQQHFLHRFKLNIEKTREVIKRIFQERLNLLEKSAQQMAENPRLLAALSTDDPGTLRDLIEDEHEGFRVFFRGQDGVLLYKRHGSQRSHWIRFDHFGIFSRHNEIEDLLRTLDSAFKETKRNRWRGQLAFTDGQHLQVFLAGAYYIIEEDAILVYADRLETSFAVELRKLTLDLGDHLIFAYGKQVVCSTLDQRDQTGLDQLLQRINKPELLGEQSDSIRTINLKNESYFGVTDYFVDIEIPIVKEGADKGIHWMMLKSRRELDQQTNELKRSLLLVGSVGFILAVLLASIISTNLAKPIRNLVKFVSELGKGTLDRRLKLNEYHGEFAELARAFDEMQVSLLEKNRELIQADKLVSLGTLSAGVAHEINNPNQYISTNAVLLEKFFCGVKPVLDRFQEKNGDFNIGAISYSEARGKIPETISAIQKGSERIGRIVKDLSDFARQNPVEQLSSINLNNVVESAERLVGNMIKKSTRFFTMNLEKDLPPIKGNFQRLEQVVINLLINACQALPDNSKRIELSTYSRQKNVVILQVKDEGRGISNEQQRQIFDPFFTTHRDRGGAGLGLSISKSIIDKHDATIEFDSELGKGTTVTVTFPVDNSQLNERS